MHLNCFAGKELCVRATSACSLFPTLPAALLETAACEVNLKVSPSHNPPCTAKARELGKAKSSFEESWD